MGSAEKKVLFAMLRSMLAYRPEQRCNIEEVLVSEWMIRYALPVYKKLRAQDALRHALQDALQAKK